MPRQSRGRSAPAPRAAPAAAPAQSRGAHTAAAPTGYATPPAPAPPAAAAPAAAATSQGPGMLAQMAATAGSVAVGSTIGHGLSSMLFGGKPKETFEYYQKAIKKIIKDENVTAKIPAILPDNSMPQELLIMLWRNFVGFLRDPAMNFREESHPDAYKLLNTFRPTATPKSQERFDRTP
ncbi:hypothetical protein DXG03_002402 [Asterophora parasitica]|uniref:Uncharacterized protein n=1 Tax=Asterophora parasitica TaxID=117018 RepID=A0A9P7GG43_9AGAR|nr:hypothetical protein DXG03_002402 [Asterophora parasitica]